MLRTYDLPQPYKFYNIPNLVYMFNAHNKHDSFSNVTNLVGFIIFQVFIHMFNLLIRHGLFSWYVTNLFHPRMCNSFTLYALKYNSSYI